MRRRAGGALLVLVALALALAACSDDDASSPEPSAELVADFAHEPDDAVTGPTSCPLSSVAFTDTSTGDPDAWSWDFGDGQASTEQNPTISPRGLAMEVTLTVTRGDQTDATTELLTFAEC